MSVQGPQLLWFLTRGSGLVALVGLTATMALGILSAGRAASVAWPRFAVASLHRTVSLASVAVLTVHVGAAIADSYAPISLLDAVVPFRSPYRTVWLGLGTCALDLLVAVAVTSLLRGRLGYRAWRAVHWAAYLSWPLAVVHGLGTGTDTKARWVVLLTAACVLAVVGSLGWRLSVGWPERAGQRLAAAALAGVATVALFGWTATGPLAANWTRRAGTPASLVGGRHLATTGSSSAAAGSGTAAGLTAPLVAAAFTTQVAGALTVADTASGGVQIRLAGSFASPLAGLVTVVLLGTPAGGGGVSLSSGTVSLGTGSAPAAFTGPVTGLNGGLVSATLTGDGHTLRVALEVTTDPAAGRFSGQLQVRPQ